MKFERKGSHVSNTQKRIVDTLQPMEVYVRG